MIARALGLVIGALAFVCAQASAAEIKSLTAIKGATIWFVEDHSVPMIAMEISLPAGSAYDPAGKAGLASFAASLLDEGAAKLNSRAFQDALADRAIQLSASTGRDDLEITLVTQTVNAAEAFQLLGMALQHPRFDGEPVARVRAQMLQDIAGDDADPESVAGKTFSAAYFAGHPYARTKDGDASGVGAISINDIRNFARTHWVRGGLKVAVAGDIGAAAIAPLLASALGKLPAATPPALPPVTHAGKPGVQIVPMDVAQPDVVFGLPGLLRADHDYLAAYVANEIIGGGAESRLTTEIREKRGLTYDASSDVVPLRCATVIQGEVATRRESVNQSVALLRDVFRKFAKDGATDQELADAKTYLTGSFPLSFASNTDTVSQLAEFQRQGLTPDYVAKRNSLIEAVTLDDIRRVAKRLFDPARLTIVVAGTPGAEKKKR